METHTTRDVYANIITSEPGPPTGGPPVCVDNLGKRGPASLRGTAPWRFAAVLSCMVGELDARLLCRGRPQERVRASMSLRRTVLSAFLGVSVVAVGLTANVGPASAAAYAGY